MRHAGTRRLETKRLILRRFVMEDARAMFENWAADQEVTRYLTWPPHKSQEVTRSVLETWTSSYEDQRFYQWAIVLKEAGERPIGCISAVGLKEETSSVEIGYCLGRPWQHQGIMTEALGAVIDFFFQETGACRLEARHDPRNPSSGRVMQRCGMTYEGTMKGTDRNNQGICDASWYAVLRPED